MFLELIQSILVVSLIIYISIDNDISNINGMYSDL